MTTAELQAQIQLAAMLVNLGLTTVERIRALFRAQGQDDDATLAAIMAEVDQRLARRLDP